MEWTSAGRENEINFGATFFDYRHWSPVRRIFVKAESSDGLAKPVIRGMACSSCALSDTGCKHWRYGDSSDMVDMLFEKLDPSAAKYTAFGTVLQYTCGNGQEFVKNRMITVPEVTMHCQWDGTWSESTDLLPCKRVVSLL